MMFLKEFFESLKSQTRSIILNIWDKIFLFSFTMVVILLFYNGMSVLTFGGIVLIYGAFLTYKGQIFLAVFSYLAADFCWVWNAWQLNDIQGVVFINLGIVFGLLASFKMGTGKMEKDLLKKDEF